MSNLFPTGDSWIEEFAKVSYGPHHDQTLDIYTPPPSKSPSPVVVFVHGGAWLRSGQRDTSAVRLARQLVVQSGCCVVVVGYRLSKLRGRHVVVLSLLLAAVLAALVFASLTTTMLSLLWSPQTASIASVLCFLGTLLVALAWWALRIRNREGVKFPQHPQDVAAAVRWTSKYIHLYNGDPDCLVLAGHSAGAHLVSLVALDPAFLEHDVKVRGLAVISGVYHSEMQISAEGALGWLWNMTVQAVWQRLLLDTVFGSESKPESFATAHVKSERSDPELGVLVITAQRELAGLDAQAQEFASQLEAQGSWVQHLTIPWTDHRTIMSGIPNPSCRKSHPVVDELTKFITHTVMQRKLYLL